jgi:uncharacterized protein (DUF983 family)
MWDFLDQTTSEKGNEEKDTSEEKECRIWAGQTCPQCGKGILDYNSLLNLYCPICSYETGGSFT